jgi:AraC-like DNA-binding protein
MIATSLLASATRPFWRLLQHQNIDAEQVFRGAGLDPELMFKPRGRYEVQRVVDAWCKAAALIDDPCLGLKLASTWKPTDFHALGLALLASATLREALGRLSRYVRVVDNVISIDLDSNGESLSCIYRTDNPHYLAQFAYREDVVWTLLLSICRYSFGEELTPIEVLFQHPAPACQGDFDAFFRCPMHFGAEASILRFASADVDQRLSAANWEIARYSDQILSSFLATLEEYDFIARVKAAIANELPSGQPNDAEIAKRFCISSRTFQRKLSAEGTNFSQVLDAVRRGLAEQYVSDLSLSLSEISFLLGFSRLSSFSRAFRRWTGQSPSAVREAVKT